MSLKVALAQINPTVGDFAGNYEIIHEAVIKGRQNKADIIIFPEMAIEGYPPEDLLHKADFLKTSQKYQKKIAALSTAKLMIVIGGVNVTPLSNSLYNQALVLHKGKIIHQYSKRRLPNYGVFDEKRYFECGLENLVITYMGKRIWISICEDIWPPNTQLSKEIRLNSVDLLINISASPFSTGKQNHREVFLSTLAKQSNCALAYVNMWGGQDELIFDGHSMAFDSKGDMLCKAQSFANDIIYAKPFTESKKKRETLKDINGLKKKNKSDELDEILKGLIVGTQDYILKNKFKGVLIGLSGGIDSALVAAIASKALGPNNVWCVSMPTRFNSSGTVHDARSLAINLGVKFSEIPIQDLYSAYLSLLDKFIVSNKPGLAGENLQARIRGNILMALSNHGGKLVLTTGNKSELAMGYCTLYGDMAGGFAVIKDLSKTKVFELSKHYNKLYPAKKIPGTIIKRPPSAELRLNQKDSDSLPDYDILDGILEAFIEKDESYLEIKNRGFDSAVVRDCLKKVKYSEYKRRQTPPGIKITHKAFSRDRRMPITNGYT
ncbi:MAG: NAD+ synthase (glutamine-hydrolyzing) [Candidatus Omnitrophota bacterium]|jgi:NAD+ synthase (glutamine-hydrolysing)